MKKRQYVEVTADDVKKAEPLSDFAAGIRASMLTRETPIDRRHTPLPRGTQWVTHDKAGGRAATRRLKQRATLAERIFHG